MEDRDQPSTLLRYSAPLSFITMAVGAFVWLAFGVTGLVHQLQNASDFISFNKSVFYMFGVGLGLSILSFVLVYEYLLGKTLTNKLSGICTKLGFGGVAIMFLLPYIVHNKIDSHAKNKGYVICHEASHQWFHSRTIVYVLNKNICMDLVQKGK